MFIIENEVLTSYIGDETSLVLPQNIKRIAKNAFEWCDTLESVYCSAAVEIIEEEAFYACRNLKIIEFSNSIIHIGARAFADCEQLKIDALPPKLKYLGEGAFECTAVNKISIPEGIIKIEANSFAHCRFLSEVVFNDNLRYIGARAFAFCAALKKIELPCSVVFVGEGAFKACIGLETATIGRGLDYISEAMFEGCEALKKVSSLSKIKRISQRAFSACSRLEEICLGDGLEYIDRNAFRRCASLRNICLPTSVKEIGENAFACCDLLKVSFEGQIESVDRFAFPDCETAYPKSIFSMYSSSFINRREIKARPLITVPACVTEFCPNLGIAPEYVAHGTTLLNNSHIVLLTKYDMRLYIGKNYYIGEEKLIKNGKLDLDLYDSFFEAADYDEKHFISSICLAYRRCMPEAARKQYERAIDNRYMEIAVFALDIDDSKILKFIIKRGCLTELQIEKLFELAAQKNRTELMSIINSYGGKASIDDIFSLDENTSCWQTNAFSDGLVITGYDGESIVERIPEFIGNKRITSLSQTVFAYGNPQEIILPSCLFYPGGGIKNAYVNFLYAELVLYIPQSDKLTYSSFIFKGSKYFDFEDFDNNLLTLGVDEAFKAMAYRVAYRVNISDYIYQSFYQIVNDEFLRLKHLLTKKEQLKVSAALENPPPAVFTDEYKAIKEIPLAGKLENSSAVFYFNSNGGLIRLEAKSDTVALPDFITTIEGFALIGVALKKLILPYTIKRTYPNSFSNCQVETLELGEDTYIAPEFFINSEGLRFFNIINSDGKKIILPYPQLDDYKQGIRRNYIFISRLKNKNPTSFDLHSYDEMPLQGDNAVMRAYYRLSSYFPPKIRWEDEIIMAALVQMVKNEYIEGLEMASKYGFLKESYKSELKKAAASDELRRRIDVL